MSTISAGATEISDSAIPLDFKKPTIFAFALSIALYSASMSFPTSL